MKKFAKIGLKKVFSAAIISGLIATAVGYSFVSSAAGTITLASSGRFVFMLLAILMKLMAIIH